MMACVVAGHVLLYLLVAGIGGKIRPPALTQLLGSAYGFALSGILALLLYAPVIPGFLLTPSGSRVIQYATNGQVRSGLWRKWFEA